ncbi:Uncharacterised protein [Mycobacteroides abscessus subsp. massiliense]|nr:Uncharacterised protein [Mycobacteroides abscessus subsp. massiliense]
MLTQGRIGRETVHHVAAVGLQAQRVGVRTARLGVLAGNAGKLDHRHARPVGEHHGHLQQRADVRADMRLGIVREGLGTVAALQQECLATRHLSQLALQTLNLRGHRDRRHAFQHGAHRGGLIRGPARLLSSRFGQGRIEALTQIRRERRQLRQLVDGDVDCPVHEPILTGLNQRIFPRPSHGSATG